jgi:hypothetical protein
MSQGRVVVRLRPGCSDGDALHVPRQGQYTQLNPPTLYLEKLAQQWMENRGEAQPGIKYILESLPTGYTMWQRPRPSDANHVDKYLFGHPDHKHYDSPNRFFPHFEHLMNNGGSSMGCPCKLCAGSAGILPGKPGSSSTSARPTTPKAFRPSSTASQLSQKNQGRPRGALVPDPIQRSKSTTLRPQATLPPVQIKGRPKLKGAGVDLTHIDEEGTPDVYRNLLDQLSRRGTVDEIIEEPLSPDWRAEQKLLPSMLQRLKHQDQWIPRVGDIVLYIRNLPPSVDIMRHERTGEFQLYNEEDDEFLGPPPWRAGLVGEVPADPPAIVDLHRSDSEASVMYSGVRVEPLPNPNDVDKSLSKRYKYVSLRQTRPFVLWKDLLGQVPQSQWHATVVNALTLTSTLSLVGKYRFRGTWPGAYIYCHGVHLGAELLVAGDAVRLLPSISKFQTRCTEVLVIKSIRLKWSNLDKASSNDYDEGRPYNSEVMIYGSAYTSDPAAMNKEYLSGDNAEPPRATVGYGEWYPLHSTSKELAIPYSRVASRLYEREAMSFFLNSDPDNRPTIDDGRDGILDARAFARKHDQRITEQPGATWYWGNNRADALDLQTINGLDVAKYDQERDIRAMRKNIKILDSIEDDTRTTGNSTSLGHRDLRTFMAPGALDLPDRTQRVRDLIMSDGPARSSASGSGRKRPPIIYLSDDEDEIRQYTKVVENGKTKKARVTVVI